MYSLIDERRFIYYTPTVALFGATSTGPANDSGDFFLVFERAVLHLLKAIYIESYILTNDYVNTMIDE